MVRIDVSYSLSNIPSGWHANASIIPAPPPAMKSYQLLSPTLARCPPLPIRFVAAEAGCLPPGPFTLFADMMPSLSSPSLWQLQQSYRGSWYTQSIYCKLYDRLVAVRL